MTNRQTRNPRKRAARGFPVYTGFLILIFLTVFFPASASVITYPGNTTNESIQDLISTAGTGDTILISSGTYNENLVVSRAVTIRALDPGNPPVIMTGTGEAGVLVTANGVTIDGLTISGNASYGLILRSDNNKIYNVTVSGFSRGIGLQSAVHNELARNRIVINAVGLQMDHDSQANSVYMNYFDNSEDTSVRTADVEWSGAPWEYRYAGKSFSGSLGNYWKKYTGADSNGDGIGDKPYRVPGGSRLRGGHP